MCAAFYAGQCLAVLERHAGRAESMPERVLEVMHPDGPKSEPGRRPKLALISRCRAPPCDLPTRVVHPELRTPRAFALLDRERGDVEFGNPNLPTLLRRADLMLSCAGIDLDQRHPAENKSRCSAIERG